MKILVAEDSELNFEMLAECLGIGGHEVSLARDGEQAIASLAGGKFDLLLLDLHMPLSVLRRRNDLVTERLTWGSRHRIWAVPGFRGEILIVEDTSDAAAAYQAVVEREGFRAVVCGTAADALAAYTTIRPVAVILDWTLPDDYIAKPVRAGELIAPSRTWPGRSHSQHAYQVDRGGCRDTWAGAQVW